MDSTLLELGHAVIWSPNCYFHDQPTLGSIRIIIKLIDSNNKHAIPFIMITNW